jgi:hypothetical protein
VAFIALSLLVFTQCEKEDQNGNSYEFIDQNLQGKISNAGWFFASGDAIEFSNTEETTFMISLHSTPTDDPCLEFYEDNYILFSISGEIGLKELSLDFSGGTESFTVTFVEAISPPQNNIATEGAVEIISIDTELGIIKGRMDIRFDDKNHVNGEFEVSICNF